MEMIEVNFRKPKRRPRRSDEGQMNYERFFDEQAISMSSKRVVMPDYPTEVKFVTEDRVFHTKEIPVKREKIRINLTPGPSYNLENLDEMQKFMLESLGIDVKDQRGKVGPKGEEDPV
jgi:hypothetical protein